MVALVYALPGCGKTTWAGTLDPATTGIAACGETGNGAGLLSIAERGFDCVVPENLTDVESFCKGEIFKDKSALVLDSASALVRTIVKDAVLSIPRNSGNSPKRKAGVLELDDYGTLAEFTRKLLYVLINANPTKHIIVTATEKYDRPNENDPPGTEALIGPDFAGQMFLGAAAMFDFVFRMRTRPVLEVPGDAKSRYVQRYLITQPIQGTIAKCRANADGKPLLDKEEIFDLGKGQGTIPALVEKILKGYQTEMV
jgi:hypothetical protein